MWLSWVTLLAVCAVILASIHHPLGSWMHEVFTSPRHLRVERWIYRAAGINPDKEQSWRAYAASVLALSLASIVAVWALIMAQPWLPFSAGRSQEWHTALNTAVSFTTNTNWQSYTGETGAGYVVYIMGLGVQQFVSAAVGISVAIVVMRGFARQNTDELGNFWVDLTRACLRVLLPMSVIGALVLLFGGVVQNWNEAMTITTVTGQTQVIPAGPVASQEVIKLLGTNGGGIFGANSAHPFENPSALTSLFETLLMLVIPFSLPRTFGLMVGDRKQGHVLTAMMGVLLVTSATLIYWAETSAASGAWEGKEVRLGTALSSLFAGVTTGTSTGAVNSAHASYSPLGGGVQIATMLLGEVAPGGVGTGLYGAVVVLMVTVFLAGLMVGRTPELLGKTLGRGEIITAAIILLTMPALVLAGTSVALAWPVTNAAMSSTGPHGLTEMLYAFTSASNNNGSAFAGLAADQPALNLMLAACMLLGRFVPIVMVLALAGSLAEQGRRPVTVGTMPTTTPFFALLFITITVVLTALTFLPTLALGPLAEALS